MLGLSLSSGGIHGISFIPFIEFLQDYDFSAYGGTSIGSFFASCLAFDKDTNEIIKKLKSNSLRKLLRPSKHPLNLDYLINMAFNTEKLKYAKHKLIIVAAEVKEKLTPYYFTSFGPGKNFLIKNALKASMAVPILAGPYKIKNREFVDGAFVEPFPLFKFKDTGIKKLLILDVNAKTKEHHNLLSSFICFLSDLLMKEFKKRSKIKILWIRIPSFNFKPNFLSYYKVGKKVLKGNKKAIEHFLN